MEQTLIQGKITAAGQAESVWVTTEFTKQDALHFAGLPTTRIHKLPMLAPIFTKRQASVNLNQEAYFIWTTNLGVHKNHENAFKALQLYYEEYNGKLVCRVTGVGTKNLLAADNSHLSVLTSIFNNSPALKNYLRVMGELSDHTYQDLLAHAQFLWHPARIDNGTFSVIEAAHLGIPSLSSDYPAMREINVEFDLNLLWMNAMDPMDMAYQLKQMETETATLSKKLPSKERLSKQSMEQLASSYWSVLEEYL